MRSLPSLLSFFTSRLRSGHPTEIGGDFFVERLRDTEIGGDFLNGEFEKKTENFKKIIDYSKEERDRIQRMHVVDRAAAAIAAARAIIQETQPVNSDGGDDDQSDSNQEARHAALGLSDEHMEGGAAVHEKENGAASLEPEFLPEDDVDMDVDMEVDEGVSDSMTALECASSTEVTDPTCLDGYHCFS